MRYVAVCPFAYQPYFDEFIKTCKIPKENMLFIDNTVENIGIMKSHNKGVEFMREQNADWLIVMSAGIRFGEKGGLDFIEELEKTDGLLLHGKGLWKSDPEQRIMALGWHLTAFHKSVFDAVGGWDENFSNYSLDDVDLTMRIQKHFGKDYKNRAVEVDMVHESTAHSVSLAKVKACAHAPRHSYFMRKWGKDCHEWQSDGYEHPFNNPKHPLSYCPKDHEPLSIWQNEYLSGGYNFND